MVLRMCFMRQLTHTDEDLLSAMLMQKEKKEEATAASAPEDATTKNGRLPAVHSHSA